MSEQTTKNAVFKGTPEQIKEITQEKDIIVPAELVPLATNGKIYPTDSILCGKTELECRYMTAADEDIFFNRGVHKSGTLFTALARTCLVDKKIPVEDMAVADLFTIIAAIRSMSYGSNYAVEIKCPSCDAQFNHTFELKDLKLNRLEKDPIYPNTNMFQVTLPKTKWNIKYKLLTAKDQSAMLIEEENRRKKGLPDNFNYRRLLYSIISINDEENKGKIAAMIRVMPSLDSLAWRKDYSETEPGLETKQDVICGSCGETSNIDIPFGPSFFYPTT